jgi:hypothetical protein
MTLVVGASYAFALADRHAPPATAPATVLRVPQNW